MHVYNKIVTCPAHVCLFPLICFERLGTQNFVVVDTYQLTVISLIPTCGCGTWFLTPKEKPRCKGM